MKYLNYSDLRELSAFMTDYRQPVDEYLVKKLGYSSNFYDIHFDNAEKLSTNQQLQKKEKEENAKTPFRILWNRNSTVIYSNLNKKGLRIHDVKNFPLECPERAFYSRDSQSIATAFNHDRTMSRIIVGYEQGDLRGYSTLLKNETSFLENFFTADSHRSAVEDIAFSNNGSKMCTCSKDKSLVVWDAYKGVKEQSVEAHGNEVTSCDWHPTKRLIVTGAKDRIIKLWQADGLKEVKQRIGHTGEFLRIRWSVNGNFFGGGGKDKTLHIYDLRKIDKPIREYKEHTKEIYSIAWHPVYENIVATAAEKIIIWDVNREGFQKEVPINISQDKVVNDVAWNIDGNMLASVTSDGMLNINLFKASSG